MSSKGSHSNFIPVVGNPYANAYLVGIITEVSPALTAKNGKEYYRFGIIITMITDPKHEDATDLKKDDLIHRQATPDRRRDGTFNKMKNFGE
jgi:hypothetical protein